MVLCEDPWTVSNALQNARREVEAGLISEEEAAEKIKAVYRGEIVCDAALPCWIPSGETCPPKPECTEGDRRYPIMCMVPDESGVMRPSGSICMEVCRNGEWVPSGETCPTKPECTEGDKKAGYVCVAGKWQPTVPEPIVEPVPEPVPPADGLFTIEFQEIIPGVTPPRVPLLIPGLETLPLLPGWIVRDAAGNIVNKGAELPTLLGIQHGS